MPTPLYNPPFKNRLTKMFIALLLTLSLFLPLNYISAQFVVEVPSLTTWEGVKHILGKIKDLLKEHSALMWKQTQLYFGTRLAQDAAVFLASGDTGQTSFIWSWDEVKNLGGAVTGEFLDNLSQDFFGKSACQPADLSMQVEIDLSARNLIQQYSDLAASYLPDVCEEICSRTAPGSSYERGAQGELTTGVGEWKETGGVNPETGEPYGYWAPAGAAVKHSVVGEAGKLFGEGIDSSAIQKDLAQYDQAVAALISSILDVEAEMSRSLGEYIVEQVDYTLQGDETSGEQGLVDCEDTVTQETWLDFVTLVDFYEILENGFDGSSGLHIASQQCPKLAGHGTRFANLVKRIFDGAGVDNIEEVDALFNQGDLSLITSRTDTFFQWILAKRTLEDILGARYLLHGKEYSDAVGDTFAANNGIEALLEFFGEAYKKLDELAESSAGAVDLTLLLTMLEKPVTGPLSANSIYRIKEYLLETAGVLENTVRVVDVMLEGVIYLNLENAIFDQAEVVIAKQTEIMQKYGAALDELVKTYEEFDKCMRACERGKIEEPAGTCTLDTIMKQEGFLGITGVTAGVDASIDFGTAGTLALSGQTQVASIGAGQETAQERARLGVGDLKALSTLGSPKNFALGQALEIAKKSQQMSEEAKEQAKTEAQATGYKPKRDAVSGKITLPGTETEKRLDRALADVRAANNEYTDSILAQMWGVFFNTLIEEFQKKLYDQGLEPKVYGGPFDPSTRRALGEGVEAAEAQFAKFARPNIIVGGAMNTQILTRLVSGCDKPYNKRKFDECIIDYNFKQAIEQEMTLQEAVDANLIKGKFGFTKGEQSQPLTHRGEGLAYNSMQVLRKYRIIPAAFEVAAIWVRDQALQTKNEVLITEVMEGYDDRSSPYYGLVNPYWVLKLPLFRCDRQGAGEEIVTETPLPEASDLNSNDFQIQISRVDDYCGDPVSCIKEKNDGSGCDGEWGYCSRERDFWRFPSNQCDALYKTCQAYYDPKGQTRAYLEETLNLEECPDLSDGCQGYLYDYNWSRFTGALSDRIDDLSDTAFTYAPTRWTQAAQTGEVNVKSLDHDNLPTNYLDEKRAWLPDPSLYPTNLVLNSSGLLEQLPGLWQCSDANGETCLYERIAGRQEGCTIPSTGKYCEPWAEISLTKCEDSIQGTCYYDPLNEPPCNNCDTKKTDDAKTVLAASISDLNPAAVSQLYWCGLPGGAGCLVGQSAVLAGIEGSALEFKDKEADELEALTAGHSTIEDGKSCVVGSWQYRRNNQGQLINEAGALLEPDEEPFLIFQAVANEKVTDPGALTCSLYRGTASSLLGSKRAYLTVTAPACSRTAVGCQDYWAVELGQETYKKRFTIDTDPASTADALITEDYVYYLTLDQKKQFVQKLLAEARRIAQAGEIASGEEFQYAEDIETSDIIPASLATDQGYVSASDVESLTDKDKKWLPNEWADATLLVGDYQVKVKSNSANKLTLTAAWTGDPPAVGTAYTVTIVPSTLATQHPAGAVITAALTEELDIAIAQQPLNNQRRYCSERDVNCRYYSPTSGAPALAGILNPREDLCPAECVGFAHYKEPISLIEDELQTTVLKIGNALKFDPIQDKPQDRYFIPNKNYECPPRYAGCEYFVQNVEAASEADLDKLYLIDTRLCVKTSYSQGTLETYTIIESSAQGATNPVNIQLLKSNYGEAVNQNIGVKVDADNNIIIEEFADSAPTTDYSLFYERYSGPCLRMNPRDPVNQAEKNPDKWQCTDEFDDPDSEHDIKANLAKCLTIKTAEDGSPLVDEVTGNKIVTSDLSKAECREYIYFPPAAGAARYALPYDLPFQASPTCRGYKRGGIASPWVYNLDPNNPLWAKDSKTGKDGELSCRHTQPGAEDANISCREYQGLGFQTDGPLRWLQTYDDQDNLVYEYFEDVTSWGIYDVTFTGNRPSRAINVNGEAEEALEFTQDLVYVYNILQNPADPPNAEQLFIDEVSGQVKSFKLSLWLQASRGTTLKIGLWSGEGTAGEDGETRYFQYGGLTPVDYSAPDSKWHYITFNQLNDAGFKPHYLYLKNTGGQVVLDHLILETSSSIFLRQNDLAFESGDPSGRSVSSRVAGECNTDYSADPPAYNAADPYPYQLNCQAYTTDRGEEITFKDITLCEDSLVGCQALINTFNTSSPGAETFVPRGYKADSPAIDNNLDTYFVPADALEYVVSGSAAQCAAGKIGCTLFGREKRDQAGRVTAIEEVYLIDDPDFYQEVTAPVACLARENDCGLYEIKEGGKARFKDPSALSCYWTRPDGQTVSNWYKVNPEDDKDLELCESRTYGIPADRQPDLEITRPAGYCREKDTGRPVLDPADNLTVWCDYEADEPVEVCRDFAAEATDSDHINYGLSPDNVECVPTVTQCLPVQSRCTLFIDPLAAGLDQYYFQIATEEVNAGNCGSMVDDDRGCRLFQDTEGGDLIYNAQASWEAGYLDTSCQTGGNCDANRLIKVIRDRTCGEWLQCTSSLVTKAGETVCLERKPCNVWGSDTEGETGHQCVNIVSNAQETFTTKDVLGDEATLSRASRLSGVSNMGYGWYLCGSGPEIKETMKDQLCTSSLDCLESFDNVYVDDCHTPIMDAIDSQSCQDNICGQDTSFKDKVCQSNLDCYQDEDLSRPGASACSKGLTDCYPVIAKPGFKSLDYITQVGGHTEVVNGDFEKAVFDITAAEAGQFVTTRTRGVSSSQISQKRQAYPLGWDVTSGCTIGSSCNLTKRYESVTADSRRNNDVFRGKYSFMISGEKDAYIKQTIENLIPETTYAVSAWLNMQKGAWPGGLEITELNADEAPIVSCADSYNHCLTAVETNGWEYLTAIFTTKAQTRNLEVKLISHGGQKVLFDNIQIRAHLEAVPGEYIAPACRLYPNSSSLNCDALDDNRNLIRGWRGYCLEPDPRWNPRDPSATNQCLNWWPVDVIQGETNVLGTIDQAGYLDAPSPLHYCLETHDKPPGVPLPRLVCLAKNEVSGGEDYKYEACKIIALASDPKPKFYTLQEDDWHLGVDANNFGEGSEGDNGYKVRMVLGHPDNASERDHEKFKVGGLCVMKSGIFEGDKEMPNCLTGCFQVEGLSGTNDKDNRSLEVFPQSPKGKAGYAGCSWQEGKAGTWVDCANDLQQYYHKIAYFAFAELDGDVKLGHGGCAGDDNGDRMYALIGTTNHLAATPYFYPIVDAGSEVVKDPDRWYYNYGVIGDLEALGKSVDGKDQLKDENDPYYTFDNFDLISRGRLNSKTMVRVADKSWWEKHAKQIVVVAVIVTPSLMSVPAILAVGGAIGVVQDQTENNEYGSAAFTIFNRIGRPEQCKIIAQTIDVAGHNKAWFDKVQTGTKLPAPLDYSKTSQMCVPFGATPYIRTPNEIMMSPYNKETFETEAPVTVPLELYHPENPENKSKSLLCQETNRGQGFYACGGFCNLCVGGSRDGSFCMSQEDCPGGGQCGKVNVDAWPSIDLGEPPDMPLPRLVCLAKNQKEDGGSAGDFEACKVIALVSDPKPEFHTLPAGDWRLGVEANNFGVGEKVRFVLGKSLDISGMEVSGLCLVNLGGESFDGDGSGTECLRGCFLVEGLGGWDYGGIGINKGLQTFNSYGNCFWQKGGGDWQEKCAEDLEKYYYKTAYFIFTDREGKINVGEDEAGCQPDAGGDRIYNLTPDRKSTQAYPAIYPATSVQEEISDYPQAHGVMDPDGWYKVYHQASWYHTDRLEDAYLSLMGPSKDIPIPGIRDPNHDYYTFDNFDLITRGRLNTATYLREDDQKHGGDNWYFYEVIETFPREGVNVNNLGFLQGELAIGLQPDSGLRRLQNLFAKIFKVWQWEKDTGEEAQGIKKRTGVDTGYYRELTAGELEQQLGDDQKWSQEKDISNLAVQCASAGENQYCAGFPGCEQLNFSGYGCEPEVAGNYENRENRAGDYRDYDYCRKIDKQSDCDRESPRCKWRSEISMTCIPEQNQYPEVTKIKLNGQEGGAVILQKNSRTVDLSFEVKLNANQKPMTTIFIDWGDGSKTGLSGIAWDEGRQQFSHTYAYYPSAAKRPAGCTYYPYDSANYECRYKPRIKVVDNWGWCNGQKLQEQEGGVWGDFEEGDAPIILDGDEWRIEEGKGLAWGYYGADCFLSEAQGVCFGGSSDTELCRSDGDCPGGFCSIVKRCSGGAMADQVCRTNEDCGGNPCQQKCIGGTAPGIYCSADADCGAGGECGWRHSGDFSTSDSRFGLQSWDYFPGYLKVEPSTGCEPGAPPQVYTAGLPATVKAGEAFNFAFMCSGNCELANCSLGTDVGASTEPDCLATLASRISQECLGSESCYINISCRFKDAGTWNYKLNATDMLGQRASETKGLVKVASLGEPSIGLQVDAIDIGNKKDLQALRNYTFALNCGSGGAVAVKFCGLDQDGDEVTIKSDTCSFGVPPTMVQDASKLTRYYVTNCAGQTACGGSMNCELNKPAATPGNWDIALYLENEDGNTASQNYNIPVYYGTKPTLTFTINGQALSYYDYSDAERTLYLDKDYELSLSCQSGGTDNLTSCLIGNGGSSAVNLDPSCLDLGTSCGEPCEPTYSETMTCHFSGLPFDYWDGSLSVSDEEGYRDYQNIHKYFYGLD